MRVLTALAVLVNSVVVPDTTTTIDSRPAEIHFGDDSYFEYIEPVEISNEDTIRFIWPDDTEDQAIRVATCESNLNTFAKRPGSQFTGLFQIGASVHAQRVRAVSNILFADNPAAATIDLMDPILNTRVALDIYQDTGWGPWQCKP